MREDIFRANVLPVGGGGPAPPTSPNPGGGGGVVYDPKTAIPAKTMLPAPKCITATNQKHRLCVLGVSSQYALTDHCVCTMCVRSSLLMAYQTEANPET